MLSIKDILVNGWDKVDILSKYPSEYYIHYTENTNNLLALIKQKLIEHGFCIIKPGLGSLKIRDFKQLEKYFSNKLLQSSNSYELEIKPKEGSTKLFAKNDSQPLHTDCANNGLEPKIVVLHCIQAALNGGFNIIVPISIIKQYIKENFNKTKLLLYDKDAITYIRNKVIITKSFLKEDGNNMQICAAYADNFIGKTLAHEQQFKDIMQYAHVPSHQIRFKLNDGETLVIENHKILHGRTAFQGERILKRLWFEGISSK